MVYEHEYVYGVIMEKFRMFIFKPVSIKRVF
jgi:hypothetical protein